MERVPDKSTLLKQAVKSNNAHGLGNIEGERTRKENSQ